MALLKVLAISVLSVFSFTFQEVEARSVKDVNNLLTADERERVFGGLFLEDVPEYDVIHPIQVDAHGNYLSRDLAHGNSRRRRSVGNDKQQESVFFKLHAFGKVLHMNVKLNTELFAPNYVVEVRGNGSSRFDYDIEYCHYTGHVISTEGLDAKVAVSNCDGLSGMIRDGTQGVLMVNPLPERLGLHKNNTPAHVIYRRSVSDVDDMARALGMEKRADNWCGVTDDPNNKPQQLDDGVISPEKRNVITDQRFIIEALVVVDKKMTLYHGVTQIKKYVPTIINMVQGLLGDSTIGADIKYVLNKLQILETDQNGLVVSRHASNTLSSFCKWTKGQNIQDDTNPAHFDHATLISRTIFCKNSNGDNCELVLGLAPLEGMCIADTSCTLSKDNGLSTAFTIAHETGHNLGAQHDGSGNACPNAVNIMATASSGKATAFEWSTCSRGYITQFLSGDYSSCLKDLPTQSVTLPASLPGQLYSSNDQCTRMIPGATGFCSSDPESLPIICTLLWCEVDSGCTTINEPAAEGTECGSKMWCRRGMCVAFGSEGPKAVDGGYSTWSSYGSCSHTCGGGVKSKRRQCNNPTPKNGGKLCPGPSIEFTFCKTPKCPTGTPHTRMTQCQGNNNVEFEDGVTYDWEYDPNEAVLSSERCKLKCTSDDTMFTFGNVKDGTMCDGSGYRGVCLQGVCKKLGCDDVLGSSAVADRCGVCNGDGSECSVSRFTFDKTPDYYGEYYQKITTLPVGARNIKITEQGTKPLDFENLLAMKLTSGKELLNMDFEVYDSPYSFTAAGTTFLYVRSSDNQETITAPGPLTATVELEFLVQDWENKYKVSYEYIKSSSSSVSPREAARFLWKMEAEGCSVGCGGGTKILFAVCTREDDSSWVDDKYCQGKKPAEKTRTCNVQKCQGRWSSGEWDECTKGCNDGSIGEQKREVTCVIDSLGEEELVADSSCTGPKPEVARTCGNIMCPAEWNTVKSGPCSTTCGKGTQALTVICQRTGTDGKVVEVADGKCPSDDKPPTSVTCNGDRPCKSG